MCKQCPCLNAQTLAGSGLNKTVTKAARSAAVKASTNSRVEWTKQALPAGLLTRCGLSCGRESTGSGAAGVLWLLGSHPSLPARDWNQPELRTSLPPHFTGCSSIWGRLRGCLKQLLLYSPETFWASTAALMQGCLISSCDHSTHTHTWSEAKSEWHPGFYKFSNH